MRRRKFAPLKPKTIVLSIFACTAVCLAGIGYVWAKTQVWGLSREMKRLEVRRDELKRGNDTLQRTYAAMCTSRELEARVKRLNLGLTTALPEQVVRLTEPTAALGRKTEPKIYAASSNQTDYGP